MEWLVDQFGSSYGRYLHSASRGQDDSTLVGEHTYKSISAEHTFARDTVDRAEIWRRIFPVNTPKGELDFARLSRLALTGGNIRNIAINAAFLAAEQGRSVEMTHLLRAAQTEFEKLGKPLNELEIGDWA